MDSDEPSIDVRRRRTEHHQHHPRTGRRVRAHHGRARTVHRRHDAGQGRHPPADDGVLLILWIEQQDGEGRIAFNLAQHGTDLRLEARITSEAGPPGAIFDETDWNPATQPWLQLREDSGTTYFEASQDGVAFDTVFQIPNPIGLDDVRVGFVGHNNVELAEAVLVSVETFELICG